MARINSSLIDGFQYVSFTSVTNTNVSCGWRSSGSLSGVSAMELYTTANFPAFHLLFPSNALCNVLASLIESRLCRFSSTSPLLVPLTEVVFVAAVWNVLTQTKARKIVSRSVHLIIVLSMRISCFFHPASCDVCIDIRHGKEGRRKNLSSSTFAAVCRCRCFVVAVIANAGEKFRWKENYD